MPSDPHKWGLAAAVAGAWCLQPWSGGRCSRAEGSRCVSSFELRETVSILHTSYK